MKLIDKLKTILFDEVTTEIPVITKEEKKEPKQEVKKTVREDTKRRGHDEKDDEIIIEKIITPKRDIKVELSPEDEEVYMPKLKEEAKEEIKKSNFTFPVFDDESEIVPSKRRSDKEDRYRDLDSNRDKPKERRREPEKKREKPRDDVGYTNAFDYSYGKYRGDYKANREQSREILTKTLEKKEEHKVFTPSPIISPVYGVLNENYNKDDIKNRTDEKKRVEPLDLDTVRKKAYGTLEDEIEVSLGQTYEMEEPTKPVMPEYEDDDEEGISISDLLIDVEDDEKENVPEVSKDENESNLDEEDMELFEKIILDGDEDSDEQEPTEPEIEEEASFTTESDDEMGILDMIDSTEEEPIEEKVDEDEEKQAEKDTSKSDNKSKTEESDSDMLGEEDLFDLIESIYERKDEE